MAVRSASTAPMGAKCVPAGTDKKGMDGWCTADSDCKCAGVGAKCVGALLHLHAKPRAGAGRGGAGGSAGAA